MPTDVKRLTALVPELEATAQRLTGRPVRVRVRPMKGLLGLTQKDLQGRAVIDLDPGVFQDPKSLARTFTHECAHVRLHLDGLPRRDIDAVIKKESALSSFHSLLRSAPAGNPIADSIKRREQEAYDLADRWMAVVDDQYRSYLPACYYDGYMAVLKILYHEVKR
jgi:hypothetical protein